VELDKRKLAEVRRALYDAQVLAEKCEDGCKKGMPWHEYLERIRDAQAGLTAILTYHGQQAGEQ